MLVLFRTGEHSSVISSVRLLHNGGVDQISNEIYRPLRFSQSVSDGAIPRSCNFTFSSYFSKENVIIALVSTSVEAYHFIEVSKLMGYGMVGIKENVEKFLLVLVLLKFIHELSFLNYLW